MESFNCEYGACISLDHIKIYLQALLPAAYTVKERGKVFNTEYLSHIFASKSDIIFFSSISPQIRIWKLGDGKRKRRDGDILGGGEGQPDSADGRRAQGNLFLNVDSHSSRLHLFLLTKIKTQTDQLLNQNQYNLIQKALVDAMAAKKKADAGGADGAKAEG